MHRINNKRAINTQCDYEHLYVRLSAPAQPAPIFK